MIRVMPTQGVARRRGAAASTIALSVIADLVDASHEKALKYRGLHTLGHNFAVLAHMSRELSEADGMSALQYINCDITLSISYMS